MLTGGLVGAFCKTPDQVLEGEPHVVVANGLRTQIGVGDLLNHLVEQIGLIQRDHEFIEAEVFKDLAGVL